MQVVTGAAGLVGNNLVRQLLAAGRRVRAMVLDDATSLSGLELEIVRGNILDPAFLLAALESADVVYHTAGLISFDGSIGYQSLQRVNVEGTANVVTACLQHGVGRLIHFSSIHALAPSPRDVAIDENRPFADGPGEMAYDRSKAESEKIVLRAVANQGLDAVILLPTWIIGPHDFRPSASGEFILQLIRRKLPALVEGGYFCVDVRDVAQAAIDAEQRGTSGQHYILPGEYATFWQLAKMIEQASGVRSPRICLPHWVAAAAAPLVERASRFAGRRPLMTADAMKIVRNHQRIETDKAAVEIGFSSRPLAETVADAVEWLTNNG